MGLCAMLSPGLFERCDCCLDLETALRSAMLIPVEKSGREGSD